jgi:hypothetical protein
MALPLHPPRFEPAPCRGGGAALAEVGFALGSFAGAAERFVDAPLIALLQPPGPRDFPLRRADDLDAARRSRLPGGT